jgi:hypothetical protein
VTPDPQHPLPPTTDDDPSAYVGLELDEARQRAIQHGWSKIRVIPDNGTVLLTLDWVSDRVSFAVGDENRVTWCGFH